MRVDFPKKSYVHVQKQKCGISNDVFCFCGSGTAEIQVTVYCAKLRNFKSQIVLCSKAELLNFETYYIPCAEAELQVAGYSLCGGGIAGLKSQSSCMEAELRNFKSY